MYYSVYHSFVDSPYLTDKSEWTDNSMPMIEEWEYYNVSEGEFELTLLVSDLKGLYYPGKYDSHVQSYKIHTACIPF